MELNGETSSSVGSYWNGWQCIIEFQSFNVHLQANFFFSRGHYWRWWFLLASRYITFLQGNWASANKVERNQGILKKGTSVEPNNDLSQQNACVWKWPEGFLNGMEKTKSVLLRILFYITLILIASAHSVIALGYVHQIFMTSLLNLKQLNMLFLEKYLRTIQIVDWSLLAHSLRSTT